jgi:hypothetical protein
MITQKKAPANSKGHLDPQEKIRWPALEAVVEYEENVARLGLTVH